MGSISYLIMPLIINSGYTDTCMHTYTHTYRCPHRNNFKKPGTCQPLGAHLVYKNYMHNNTTIMLDQYFLIKESLMLL